MRSSSLFAILASAAGSALAHMEMIDPFPILSPANPAVHWEVKNYDMMAPLLWPGDNLPYPCKGYLWSTPQSERNVQKTWPAGTWQSVTLGPNGAPHKGGSCQMSLSYDYGRTWQVILSIIGGCPVDSYRMDFELPAEAPSGEAVFSWSWFNHEGNREMYQNCAIINVSGGGAGLPTSDYPPPFVANAGVNGCSTIEGVDPVFPNPGKNVRFGGPYRGQWITEQRGIRGSNCVDQYAGETPAGSRGRSVAEPSTTAAPSSSSSITTSSASTSSAETSTTSSTAAEQSPTSTIGNQHNATPLPESSSTTTSSVSTSLADPTPSSTSIITSSPSPSTISALETSSTTSPFESSPSTTTDLASSTSTAEPTSEASTSTSIPSTSSTTATQPAEPSDPSPSSTSTFIPFQPPISSEITSPSATSSLTDTTSSSTTTTTTYSSSTSIAAPTSSPGWTCKRKVKRTAFDPKIHSKRLVRRPVKRTVLGDVVGSYKTGQAGTIS